MNDIKMMNPAKNESKKDQRIAREACEYAYNRKSNTYGDICEAYGKPSAAKVRAWDGCKSLCAMLNGFDLIISARNSMKFSAMFKYADAETGELCYCYITPAYNRFCFA